MDNLPKPEVLSAIPESPNGTDQVVLIIDTNRTNQTMLNDGGVDCLRNGKSKEEKKSKIDEPIKPTEQPEALDDSLGSTQFTRELSLANIYQGSGNVGSSKSFSVDSDNLEIDWNDDRTRKTGVGEIELETNNSRSPDKQKLSEEEAEITRGTVPALSRSMYSKPKSRFVEARQSPSNVVEGSTNPFLQRSPDRTSSTTPRASPFRQKSPDRTSVTTLRAATPRTIAEEEEDDPFKDDDLPDKKKKHEVGMCLLLEWTAFVVLVGMLISSLTVDRLEHHMVLGLEIWKWCLMVLVVFCGRLVSGWFISTLVFMVERNFILRKRVLYFVYGLRKSVQNCIWLALLILAWSLLFDPQVERSTKSHKVLAYVTRLLAAFFVAAVTWLLKILLVKVMASTFHVNTFFDRIQESIFHQYVLGTLSGPPVMEIQQSLRDERKLPKSSNDDKMPVEGIQVSFRSIGVSKRKGGAGGKEEVTTDVINVEELTKLNQKNVSAWKMKRLMKVIRHSGLSTIANTIDESEHRRDTEITNELQAIAAAKSIFKNVAKPGAKYIEEEDLLRFLKKSEVESIFPQFEGAIETGKIKKSALKNWVVNVYLERKSLAHSLNDTKTAVKQLHQIANAIVTVIMIIIILLVLGIATSHVILLVSSQLVLAGFIFGNTCKTVFEAIVFVFVMHPFDVGDRCVVDGVQMIVEEMNILTTVFLRYDNEKIYYPNSALATKPISNFYRSPEMGDSVEFTVDASTSIEKIGALKERIAKYLESKPQHWHPKHSVAVLDIQNLSTMKMALYTQHTINHQNMGEKSNRRSELVLEMKKIFEELDIQYHLLPQEIHIKFVGSATNQIPLQC